jgi:hypothetical protein
MLRFTPVFFLVGLLPHTIFGAPFQPIVGLPSSYIPGQAVSFEVRLPDITDLGSYNIDVVIESTIGTAGVDFFFDAGATMPASSNYIFPSAANFFDSVTVDSAPNHRITLTDFDFTGVDVVTGVNDRVATVVFQTGPTFGGSLSVFVDAPLLILDTPAIEPTPVSGFSAIQADIAAAGPAVLMPVPEPTTALLLVLGATVGAWRARRFAVPVPSTR